MQYGQRKLQRSITEMRRSCSARPRVSTGTVEPPSATMRPSVAEAIVSHHRYSRVTKPLGQVLGPGGSSTKPSVPASETKSPEPRVGRGFAHGRPQSSYVTSTGRKYASAD